MRETRSITITILNQGTSPQPSPTPSSPEEKNEKTKESTKSNAQHLASWLVHQALNEAKTQILTAVDYEFTRYYSTHDDYIGQRNYEVAKTFVGMAVSVGTSIYAGAKVGASAGPIGAVVGAAAGATFSGVSMALQYSRAMESQQLRVDQMNAQLSYTRQRSGYSLTSGSIGEDR